MIPGVASAVARCILAVTLILCGWKYWAVVFADVGANLVGCVAMQLARKMPIRFQFDWTDAREYLRFGVPLLGSGILIFLVMNMDNFLVGSRMGSAKLGYYALAFTWGSFICGLLSDTVNNVMFPAFSAIQDDTAAMRRWYLKTVDMVGFVAVVANTALLANVHFFLVTFLGKGTDKWLPAATALKILCVYGIIRAITEPIGNCIMARGRTKMLLHANALAGAVELLLILLVLRTGRIELVAAAVLIAYVTQAIIYLPYLAPRILHQLRRSCRAIVAGDPCAGWGLRGHIPSAGFVGRHILYACLQRIVHCFGRRFDPWTLHPLPLLPGSGRNDFAKPCSRPRVDAKGSPSRRPAALYFWRICSLMDTTTAAQPGYDTKPAITTLRKRARKCCLLCRLIAAACWTWDAGAGAFGRVAKADPED